MSRPSQEGFFVPQNKTERVSNVPECAQPLQSAYTSKIESGYPLRRGRGSMVLEQIPPVISALRELLLGVVVAMQRRLRNRG